MFCGACIIYVNACSIGKVSYGKKNPLKFRVLVAGLR